MVTVGFIGVGRTGSALAMGLAQAGYLVVASSRSQASARRLAERVPGSTAVCRAQAVADAADVVLITTPDDAIAEVAASVEWLPHQAAVHCSGALTLESLSAPAAQGAAIGSLHPVHTFGPVDGPAGQPGKEGSLMGAAFGIEADGPLFDTLAEMARSLGGVPLRVSAEARRLYHAAAVMVCGYSVGLFNDAAGLWRQVGLPTDLATPALVHLVQATFSNILSLGVEASQTGPVSRGDAGTVQAHLEALRDQAPELLPVYSAIAQRAVMLAVSSGRLPKAELPEWEELLAYPRPKQKRGS